jgi:hypothetical protein
VPNKTVFYIIDSSLKAPAKIPTKFQFFSFRGKTQRRIGCFINGSFHQLRSARTLKACFIYMPDFAGRRNLAGTLSEGEGSLQLASPLSKVVL